MKELFTVEYSSDDEDKLSDKDSEDKDLSLLFKRNGWTLIANMNKILQEEHKHADKSLNNRWKKRNLLPKNIIHIKEVDHLCQTLSSQFEATNQIEILNLIKSMK